MGYLSIFLILFCAFVIIKTVQICFLDTFLNDPLNITGIEEPETLNSKKTT